MVYCRLCQLHLGNKQLIFLCKRLTQISCSVHNCERHRTLFKDCSSGIYLLYILLYWYLSTLHTVILVSIYSSYFSTGIYLLYILFYWYSYLSTLHTFLLVSIYTTYSSTGIYLLYILLYWYLSTLHTALLASIYSA